MSHLAVQRLRVRRDEDLQRHKERHQSLAGWQRKRKERQCLSEPTYRLALTTKAVGALVVGCGLDVGSTLTFGEKESSRGAAA